MIMKQENNTIKTCKKCVLHTSIPAITVNEEGLCSYCRNIDNNAAYNNKVSKFLIQKMESLFKNIKNKNYTYDVLVSYSGGKDSSFLLYLLKEKYQLNPLAFSVIHPLVNERAIKNMEETTEKLNIDLIKYNVNKDMYKEMMTFSLNNGYQYGIGERSGCITCGAVYKWASLKMAAKMNIPVVVDGVDTKQELNHYTDGYFIKSVQDLKPAGIIHSLFSDCFGSYANRSLINFDMEDLEGTWFPAWISPFSFLNYDFDKYFNEFSKLGFNYQNFKSLVTNCSAVHMFDYLSFKRYDCPSYIREYAKLIYEDDTLLDAKINVKSVSLEGERIDRQTLLDILEEYKNLLFYVVDNNVNKENVDNNERERMQKLCPVSRQYYDNEVFETFIDKILDVNYYINYFKISKDKFKPMVFPYGKVYLD